MSLCNNTTGGVYDRSSLVILSSSNGATVFVCLFAIMVTVFLGLFRQTVYRLALYQVLAALEIGMVLVAQINLLNNSSETFCVAMAFLFTQAMWAKLLLTVWVTFHLVSFAVFHMNYEARKILSSEHPVTFMSHRVRTSHDAQLWIIWIVVLDTGSRKQLRDGGKEHRRNYRTICSLVRSIHHHPADHCSCNDRYARCTGDAIAPPFKKRQFSHWAIAKLESAKTVAPTGGLPHLVLSVQHSSTCRQRV